jgi:hypothetical protein
MRESLNQDVSDLAVVGGGRWALVICSVLERIVPRGTTIWLVSSHLSADRVPSRVRRIFDTDGLPPTGAVGAAIIATAPHDHAETAKRLLSAHWHVLIEKPVALTVQDAQAIVDSAALMKLQAWAGLVYLFASYLSVMKPHALGQTRWLLEWQEPDQEMRWGELKSTPRHVNIIEDIFPHAWSILRAAGLTAPLGIQQVDTIEARSARLNLTTTESKVELIFNRHAGQRRRFLQLETNNHRYDLDFTEEPGIFTIDGVVGDNPTWNPEMRPLTLELTTFLATCAGRAIPEVPIAVSQSLEAVALMQEATKAFLQVQARAVAAAQEGHGTQARFVAVLYDALCREAAMSGVRLKANSEEERALTAAAHAFLGGRDAAFAELPDRIAAIAQRSPFLGRVRQERDVVLARSR